MIENTKELILGKIIEISKIEDIEPILLDMFFSNYNQHIKPLELDLEYMKLTIVKAGLVDITLKTNEKQKDNIIRVMLKTEQAGSSFFNKNIEIDADEFISNWKNNFNKLLPLTLVIVDACSTDNLGIWDDKYFYG